MTTFIKDFKQDEKGEVISVYQEVFAGPPWYESWSYDQVSEVLEYCLNQEEPKVKTARDLEENIVGFSWGYKPKLEENFPFLIDQVKEDSFYIKEVAVKEEWGRKGIGESLTKGLIADSREKNLEEVVLRTKRRNGDRSKTAAYNLYSKLGFKDLGRLDEDDEYEDRVYLKKEVEVEQK